MQYRLNYGQLIQYYVETFARTDPKVALRYLYLVGNVRTKHGMRLFLRGTADVVMESKQVRPSSGHARGGCDVDLRQWSFSAPPLTLLLSSSIQRKLIVGECHRAEVSLFLFFLFLFLSTFFVPPPPPSASVR